jgi:RNA polymerase sigma-70 factor (ECF subfamily)
MAASFEPRRDRVERDAGRSVMETGSREELENAIEAIHPACFGWAMVCCRWDREEAEDVLQTSYLKVLDGKVAFNGYSSVKTWLFGVVRNTASERRRYNLVRLLRRAPLEESRVEDPSTPESLACDLEAQRTLRAQLARLSSRQRDILHLVYYQELTVEEA